MAEYVQYWPHAVAWQLQQQRNQRASARLAVCAWLAAMCYVHSLMPPGGSLHVHASPLDLRPGYPPRRHPKQPLSRRSRPGSPSGQIFQSACVRALEKGVEE